MSRTSIYERQNDNFILQCLALQRKVYSSAKKVSFKEQMGILAFAIFSTIAAYLNWDCLNAIASLFSVILAIFSRRWDQKIDSLRKHAAAIQEYIDISLYSAYVPEFQKISGAIPSRETLEQEIRQQAIDAKDIQPVRNWYQNYSESPLEIQVYCCQKENITWDSTLRKHYQYLQVAQPVLLVVIYLFFLSRGGWSFMAIINTFTWAAPIINYFCNIYAGMQSSIENLRKLSKDVQQLDDIMSEGNLETVGDRLVRIQSKIRRNRENSVFVPDCFFRLDKCLFHKQ